MNEIERDKLIKQRYKDLQQDTDLVSEIIGDYNDSVGSIFVKYGLDGSKFGPEVADYLLLKLYDYAETEIDYENQSDSINEAIGRLYEN